MKLFPALILLTTLSSFGTLNCSLIDWSVGRKLSWSDFKASPDKNSLNAALTGTNIKFDFSYNSETGFKYHIYCQFDKNSSWGKVKTDYILAHEQGHFDIAEIYARKLCKAFREYQPDIEKANKEVNKLYDNLMKQLTEAQKQYDYETQNSINTAGQKKWLKQINDDLESLRDYADYH